MAQSAKSMIGRVARAVVPVVLLGTMLAGCGSGSGEQLAALSATEVTKALDESPPKSAAQRQLDAHAGALLPADGKPHEQLKALIRETGGPVVVNLWADYCAPCRDELPLFQRAALEFRGTSTVIGAATLSNRSDSEKYLRTIALPYPSFLDDDGLIGRGTGLSVLPKTIFFTASGERVYVKQGPYRTLADLQADIRRYLS